MVRYAILKMSNVWRGKFTHLTKRELSDTI